MWRSEAPRQAVWPRTAVFTGVTASESSRRRWQYRSVAVTGSDADQRAGIQIRLRVGGALKPSLAVESVHVNYSGTANPPIRSSALVRQLSESNAVAERSAPPDELSQSDAIQGQK